MKGDAFVAADAVEVFVVGAEFIEVIAPSSAGIDVEFAARFNIVEERGFIEVQIEFGAIEGLKERKFVAPGAELAEAFFQRIKRGEEVGNDNHEPALLD